MPPRFIVAELSKNWPARSEYPAPSDDPTEYLSWLFERCINLNRQRGYRLMSWQLHRLVAGHDLNETIIAVFERVE